MSEAQPTLHMKLSAILGEVPHIPKTGYNAHFKYNFVQESDVLDTLRPKLAQAAISVAVGIHTVTRVDNLTTALGSMLFTDSETGEQLSIDIAGQGSDNQDKGLPKAITMAVKYALMKSFLIGTGDDAESTDETGAYVAYNRSEQRVAAPGSPEVAAARAAAAPRPTEETLPWEDGYVAPAAPAPAPAPEPARAPTGSGRTATPGQQRLLTARKIAGKLNDDEFENIIKHFTGQTNVAFVTMDDVDAVKEAIDALGAHKAGA